MSKNGSETPAGRAWIWVLACPQTKACEALLTVEMEDRDLGLRRTLPVFETRDQALALKPRLCPDQPERYDAQAMHLADISRFAVAHKLEILLLDAAGTILASLNEPEA